MKIEAGELEFTNIDEIQMDGYVQTFKSFIYKPSQKPDGVLKIWKKEEVR